VTRVLVGTIAALVAAFAAVTGAQQTPPPQDSREAQTQTTPAAPRQPAFRAGIDIVSLNVTVHDSMGRYITDLEQSEFNVFENGIKQEVTFFNRRQNPIALSMLLDSSASMEHKLPMLQTAATNFVRRLKPSDVAEIVDFDGGVTIRQGFTANHADLERGILQMNPGGSTALHNAIYVALNDLKKAQVATDEEPRRQALIVFSDGEDTSSLMTFEDVLDRAKHSETAIYTIGLRDAQDSVRGFRQAEYVLRSLAQETGGRAFFPANLADLAGVYGEIADELGNQ
jgi:Ca-activated chloride channel family protein